MMQIKVARIVLEHWDRIYDLSLHLDVIRLCLKFRGIGQIIAVDKTGAFFVANFIIHHKVDKSTTDTKDIMNRSTLFNSMSNTKWIHIIQNWWWLSTRQRYVDL